MRNIIKLGLVIFSFSCVAQDMERVRHTLDTLCSPTYHGRGYIESGDKKAAIFIANSFNSIGLKSHGPSYFQEFSFPINTFPKEMSLKIGPRKLILGKEYIPEAGSSSGKAKRKICYLDTLLFSDSALREKFLQEDCEKIIIYSSSDFPKLLKLPKPYIDKFYCFKARIEVHKNKLTASVSPTQETNVGFNVLEDALLKKAKQVNYKIEAVHVSNYTSQNVIGYIPTTYNNDSLIVIAAHYDHLGRMGKEIYFPGANDNASGISMLLEFAYFYKSHPQFCKYNICFIAFGAEEAGLIGSKFFVNNPLFPLSKIKFLINLDLVGTGDDGIAIVNGSIYKEQFDKILTINNEEKYFPLIKKRGEAANSDHYYFYKQGVPSFFIYTLGGKPFYHDIEDVPSQLTLKGYSKLFQLITRFLLTN